jgi:hypothetical protein
MFKVVAIFLLSLKMLAGPELCQCRLAVLFSPPATPPCIDIPGDRPQKCRCCNPAREPVRDHRAPSQPNSDCPCDEVVTDLAPTNLVTSPMDSIDDDSRNLSFGVRHLSADVELPLGICAGSMGDERCAFGVSRQQKANLITLRC